jgi:MoxR-like ATPase
MDPSRLTRLVVAGEARLKRDQESRSQAHDGEGQPLYRKADGRPTTDPKTKVQKTRGGEPLYLAVLNWYTPEGKKVQERSLQGRGCTVAELDALCNQENRYYGTMFADAKGRDAYLADPNNRLMEPGERAPFLEPTRHKPAYVRSCIEQLDALAGEVRAYGSALDAHIAGLEATIVGHLWVDDAFAGPATRSLGATRSSVVSLASRLERLRKGFEMLPQEVEEDGEGRSP